MFKRNMFISYGEFICFDLLWYNRFKLKVIKFKKGVIMKLKKGMLIALVVMAILTIGAVSASEDIVSDDLTVSNEAGDVQLSLENDENDVVSEGNSSVVVDEDDEENPYYIFVNEDEIITDSENEDYDENAMVAGIILPNDTEDGHLDVFTDDDVEIYSLIVRAVGEGDWQIDENGNLKSHIFLKDLDLTNVNDGDRVNFIFFDENGDKVDEYATSRTIEITESYIKFSGENSDEGDDEEDGPIVSIFADTSKDYPTSGDGDESLITVYAQNGEEYHVAIFSSKKFFFDKNLTDFENIVPVEGDEELEGYYKYEITLNDVDFFNGSDDGDKIWIGVYKIEDCYKWMDASSQYHVLFNGNSSFRLLDALDIRIFYGNLTSGETEEGMITFATDKFIEINIPSSSSAVGVNVAVDFGDKTKTYSLDDFDFEEVSDEEFSGKIYYIELNDEIKNMIRQHENQNITFNLSYGFNGKSISVSFKRILMGNVFYKINTLSDLNYLFDFNIASDVLNSSDDEAVNIFCFDSNWHWAHNDLGGGYFKVYVNDNCVVSLELHSQLVDYSPRGVSFSLDDLGISTSGNYTIKITQLPDNETEIDEETGKIMPQYKFTGENEIISKDVVVNFEDVYEPVDPELTVELSKDEYEFEEIIEITIRSLASPVTVSVDGNTYTIAIVDGVGILQIPNLNAGNYTVIAISEKTDLYQAGEVNKTFSVNKVDVPLTLSVADIEVGQTAVLNIEMGKAINGDVLVSLAGNNYTVSLTNGKASLNVSDLKAGDYEAVAIYAGDINYNSVLNTTSFKVSKLTPTIEITVGEAVEGSDLDVTVEVPDATGSVVVNDESVALADGKAVATIENLVAGDLTVEVNYAGDDKYSSASKNVTVVVKAKESPDLEVIVDDIDFGETVNVNITVNVNVTGKLTVDGVVVEIDDGKGTYTISGLNAGNYNLTVAYEGDKYFNADEKTVAFKVNRIDSVLNASNVEFDYGGFGIINATFEGATGIEAQIIDHDHVVIEINDAQITVSNLSAGTHALMVTTIPDENHNPVTEFMRVVVNKVDSKLTVEDIVFDYGSYGASQITFDGAKGVIGKIDDTNITADGNVIIISGLDAGNYTMTVTTVPDDNHYAVSVTASVVVNRVDSSVSVPAISFDYGSSGSSNVVLDGASGFNAAVDDDKAVVTVEENVITVSGLDVGTYTLTVTTVPDENHNSVTATATVTVNEAFEPIDPGLTVTVEDIIFGEFANVVIATNNTYSGDVLVQIGGGNYTVSVVDGSGSLILPGLASGQYNVKVVSTPTDIFKTAESAVTFVVNKLATGVSAAKISTTYGTSKNLVVTLMDANGNILVNKTVTVKLNNVVYKKTTNSKGQVSVAVPKTLAVKTYTASITFAGDDNYAKSTGSQKVVVSKATPKLTAKAKTFNAKTKTKKYTATLKTDKNAALKDVKVTLKVNGKTYSVKTNSKGQAIFKITKLTKKGKFTAYVNFAGNAKYKAINKKIKLTAK